jgi:hypothetical protein
VLDLAVQEESRTFQMLQVVSLKLESIVQIGLSTVLFHNSVLASTFEAYLIECFQCKRINWTSLTRSFSVCNGSFEYVCLCSHQAINAYKHVPVQLHARVLNVCRCCIVPLLQIVYWQKQGCLRVDIWQLLHQKADPMPCSPDTFLCMMLLVE